MNSIIESVDRIEPCRLEAPSEEITDAIAEISAASASLGSRLSAKTAASLADLVRIMNCYYSNLIEGHNTRPKDIERALQDDLDTDEERRNLQIEAKSHIRVQREIDRMYAEQRLPDPASIDFIKWLHREFYQGASETMLRIEGASRSFIMTPGEFRSEPEHDIAVGRHLPPSSDHVENFMRHFQERYEFEPMGKGALIINMGTAHHRLNYIHPFPDGNGRVSRLMSHAMGLIAGIGAHGLWSISRGLARGLEDRGEYKQMMDHADMPRQGGLNGRGNLSESALSEFVSWFLRVALDQINFMSEMFDFDQLADRLGRYVERHDHLRPEAVRILEEVLIRGEMRRGTASRVTGLSERSARSVLSQLITDGILTSDTEKRPVSLHFDIATADLLFPRLFA